MTQNPAGPAGWPGADLAALVSDWWKPFFSAPATLTQPILPGWTVGPSLTINHANSSAPQTEVEVVARHSYGRQLGRICDALDVLIGNLGEGARDDPRVASYLTMTREISEVKLDSAAQRVRQLQTDLGALKTARPQEYQQLRESLRAILEPE
jgi:hypothetical protein